jgi:hypothetical protein
MEKFQLQKFLLNKSKNGSVVMLSEGNSTTILYWFREMKQIFLHDCCQIKEMFFPFYNQLQVGFQAPVIFTLTGRKFLSRID